LNAVTGAFDLPMVLVPTRRNWFGLLAHVDQHSTPRQLACFDAKRWGGLRRTFVSQGLLMNTHLHQTSLGDGRSGWRKLCIRACASQFARVSVRDYR
jgi:hypothetical protein